MSLALFTFVACGIKSATPPHAKMPSINGYVVDGPISNATVQVFSFAAGVKGDLLGTAQTNSRGYYEVRLRRNNETVILIEASSGDYYEDVSDLGTMVSLKPGETLKAVAFSTPETATTVHVTPYTYIATGLAEYLIGKNITMPVTEAITRANAAVSHTLGDINITATSPLRSAAAPQTMMARAMNTDVPKEYLYGLYTGALSVYAKDISALNNVNPYTNYTSIGLARLMYQDIQADGVLDGKDINLTNGAARQLRYGAESLNSTRYRKFLGQGALQLANLYSGSNNIPFENVVHDIHAFAESRRDALFGLGVPMPFDSDPPTLSQPVRTNYAAATGIATYRIEAQDAVGVHSIKIYVDNVLVNENTSSNTTTLPLHLNDVGPGPHTLSVEAMDILGNSDTRTFPIIMPDGKPVVELTSTTITNNTAYVAQGSYLDDENAGITSINIGVGNTQVPATIDRATGRWQAALTLADGDNNLQVRITNNKSAFRDTAYTVSVDTLAPSVAVGTSGALFYRNGLAVAGDLSSANTGSDPLFVASERISYANPTAPPLELNTVQIPYYTLQVADNLIANGVSVYMQYRKNAAVLSPLRRLRPAAEDSTLYVIPLISEMLANAWYQSEPTDVHFLDFEINDAAGNKTVKNMTFKAFFELPKINVATSVSGARVHAHEFINGALGGQVGSCVTDILGQCGLRVLVDPGLIHFKLMDGGYQESATGIVAPLRTEEMLTSILDFHGVDTRVAITPYTHLGMGLIQHAVNSGVPPLSAYNQGLADLATLYGYDIFGTVPDDPTKLNLTGATLPGETRYALLLAGLSNWTAQLNTLKSYAPHSVYTSVSAAQLFYADALADGLLNGSGTPGTGDVTTLTLGDIALDANTYRATLAGNILNFATGNYSLNSTSKNLVFQYAQGLAENPSAVFNGATPASLNAAQPIITLMSERATKLANYSATVRVLSGSVAVTQVTVAGIAAALDANGDWIAPVTLTQQGPNHLLIRALGNGTVELGNQSVDVTWDNIAPTLTITTPASTANLTSSVALYTLAGTAADMGGIARVTVRTGSQVLNVTNEAWSAQVDLASGVNMIVIEAADTLGNVTTQQISVDYFVAGPNVQFSPTPNARTANIKPQFTGTVDAFGLTYTMSATLYNQQGTTWTTLKQQAVVANAQATWNIDFFADNAVAALIDGVYKLGVTATNSMQNVSLTEFTFVVDTLGPNVRVISPLSVTRSNPFTLIVEAIDNSGTLASVTVDALATVAQANNQWAYATPAFTNGDGIKNFVVVARDDLGNVSQNTFGVTLDTLGPSLTITAPPAWVNTANIALAFSASDITLPVTSVVTVEGVTVVPDAQGNVALQKEGSNTITVTATDGIGNQTSKFVVVGKDTGAPALSVTPASLPAYVNTASVAFAASATDTYSVPVLTIKVAGATQGTSTSTGTTTTWSGTALTLNEGLNNITVDAADALLNNAPQVTLSVTRDTLTPALTVASSFTSLTPAFNVVGTTTDINPQTITIKNAAGTNFSAAYVSGQQWSIAVSGLSVGSNSLTVTANDKAGNSVSQNIVVTYVTDTTAPTLSVANTGTLTNTGTNAYKIITKQTKLSVNANDNTGGTGMKNVVFTGGGNATARTVATATANIYTDTYSQTSNGTYNYTATAVDNANNSAAITVSLVYDTTLPILTMATNFIANDDFTSFTVSGTATEANPDKITLTKTNTSQSGTQFSTTYVSGGTWSVTVTGLVMGSNTLSVVASDKAGNVSITKNITITR
ncbi:MAG: hypothetical protein AABY83_03275 [Pseudomonadota bacterium]